MACKPVKMERIVYVSGIHGSGKTTLIHQLGNNYNVIVPEDSSSQISKIEHTSKRAIIRLSKYYLDAVDHKKIHDSNPSSGVLFDRCIYDNIRSEERRGGK